VIPRCIRVSALFLEDKGKAGEKSLRCLVGHVSHISRFGLAAS
jgi:hypothetical protein